MKKGTTDIIATGIAELMFLIMLVLIFGSLEYLVAAFIYGPDITAWEMNTVWMFFSFAVVLSITVRAHIAIRERKKRRNAKRGNRRL